MVAILETFKGIFSGDTEQKPPIAINTPEQQALYDMAWQDYQIFKSKRQEIEDTWRMEDRFYEGGIKQWEGLRSQSTMRTRPNSVDNLSGSQIESIKAGLTGWSPTAVFEGQEPNDDPAADKLNAYMPWEMQKIGFDDKYIKAVHRFVLHGLWLTKCIYDPNVSGGYGNKSYLGQNDFIPMDYGSFFPDPRIMDFLYIQQSKALILHFMHDVEYFADNFGEQGAKVTEDNMSADVEIFKEVRYNGAAFNVADIGGDGSPYQSKRSGLIEYWYRGKPKMVSAEDKQLFKEEAAEKQKQGIDPSVYLGRIKGEPDGVHCLKISTSGVFLKHVSYVYDHGEYPIQIGCLFPIEGTPWPKGYMRDMISPQVMLNKFAELAVEIMAKQGNTAIVYEETAITKPTVWAEKRSTPAAMLPIEDITKFKELAGAEVPETVFRMLEYYKDMLQKIPRRYDSANGESNSEVTSGEQAKTLQNASAGNLGIPSKIIQSALKGFFRQYICLMAQFYKDGRVARVTGQGTVEMSRSSIVGQAPTTVNQDNKDQQMMEEYVPDFDIKVSIGSEKPTDRQYWVNLAFQMFQTVDPTTGIPLIDAKAVQYTIAEGRMEPMSVIEDRMGVEQKQMSQLQQLQQQVQADQQEIEVLNEMVKQFTGHLQDSQGQNGQTDSDTLKTLEEGKKNDHQQSMDMQKQGLAADQQVHSQQMDKAKMLIEMARLHQAGKKQAVTTGASKGKN